MNKFDWHQQIIADLFKSPLVLTRVGFAYTSIGHLFKFNNIDEVFPVTTAKKLFFDQVKRELYCFLNGLITKDDLHKHKVHIWDKDMEKRKAETIGPIYGWQWKNWTGFGDQLEYALKELIDTGGTSRRAIVTAWNPAEVLKPPALLPPCHLLYQFNIVDNTLYTDVFQRSADAFLGLPFDVASFAIISRLMKNSINSHTSSWFGLKKEVLNYHISNLHLYKDHTDAALQELKNEASGEKPWLMTYNSNFANYHYDMCNLHGYNEKRIIKAKLLV